VRKTVLFQTLHVALDVTRRSDLRLEVRELARQQLGTQLVDVGVGYLGCLHDIADSPVCEEDPLDLEQELPVEVVAEEVERAQDGDQDEEHEGESVDPAVRERSGVHQQFNKLVYHFGERVVFLLIGAGHAAVGHILEGPLILVVVLAGLAFPL
jgi:hypothetical protein